MTNQAWDTMSGDSRVWIFGASTPLPADAASRLRSSLDSFVRQWTSHNESVDASAEILHDRFVVVAVDETVSPSGCSIDTLFRFVAEAERGLGVRLLDSSLVFYREDGLLKQASRDEFRQLSRDGRVGEETEVFDSTVDRFEDLRDGSWIKPAGESWHRRLLG